MEGSISKSIFRAYDIRGIVPDTLNDEVAYLIGLAVGSTASEYDITTLVVGRDGRESSPGLVRALAKGLQETGHDVIDLGELPSPGLYYGAKQLTQGSGVMVTGSHNPPLYNGIKVLLGDTTLAEDAIQKLYHRMVEGRIQKTSSLGSLTEQAIFPQYLKEFSNNIHLARPLKVVVDCGNGIAGKWVPQLFKAIGCEVVELFCEVDGTFPNHHPNPSEPENLQTLIQTVKETRGDVGFAFDGDGDRLGLITNTGAIVWPDRIMMLVLKNILAEHPGATIPFDVKCSKVLGDVINQLGGKPFMTRTGHSLIKKSMEDLKAPFAGEMSGHLFFSDRWYGIDDGPYAAARVCEILSQTAESSEVVFNQFPKTVTTPELHIPIAEEDKFDFMNQLVLRADEKFPNADSIITIDGLRVEYKNGWGLVRASNTTPVLTLRFEASDESGLEKIQNDFRTVLLEQDGSLRLPF